jgi:SAM-dependent methyltransferase
LDFDSDYANHFEWQYHSSEKLVSSFPDWNVAGKEVLEIGCGTGGRASYIAAAGAKRVVGIDINAEEIAIANRLRDTLHPELANRLTYEVSNEDQTLDLGTFDVCLLIDCLEHVVSPPAIMRLAYNYTRPGGKCYASCYGYYHHRGSHTGLMPFVNVLFSDEQILNYIRRQVSRPGYVPHRFDSDPPIERWRGIYDFRDRPGEHLNMITLREMKMLVKYSIFQYAEKKVIGFGNSYCYLKLFDWLRHVPLIQEMYHSYAVLEFRR